MVQVRLDGDDEPWLDKGTCYGSTFIVPGVRVGKLYNVRVQSVTNSGLRSDGVVASITTTGKDNPPSDVKDLFVEQDQLDVAVVHLSWPAIDDLDRNRYEIRVGTEWDDEKVKLVVVTQETRCTYRIPGSGSYTFWIKAIDNSGNYSEKATRHVTNHLIVEPGAPQDLAALQSAQDRSVVILSWIPSASAVDYYEVWLGSDWDKAQLLCHTKDVHFNHLVQESGKYTYLVRTHNLAGFYSSTVEANITVTVEPSDVAKLLAIQNGTNVYLQWSAVEEPDVVGYEIREGNSFASGSLMVTGVTDLKTLIPIATETIRRYHVKAINRAGYYSQNEASASVAITNLPPRNVIFGADELIAQNGTHEETEFRSSNYRCNTVPYECSDPMLQNRTAVDFGTQIVLALKANRTEGTYTSIVHDLGALTAAEIAAEWRTSAFLALAVSARLQARISTDNVIWSDWQDFVPSRRTLQYLQLRAVLATTDVSQSPEVVTWIDSVDVPDTIKNGQGISVPAGGLEISFTGDFYSPPTVTATAHIGAALRLAGITNITRTGFTARVYDLSGNDVGGTIDWIAKGY